jgi:hypothetical protein
MNISQIEKLIDEKMNELIGKGDYTVGYSKDQNRFIVSFRKSNVGKSLDMVNEVGSMAIEVVDYVNIEKNILRVGNYGEDMFWLTWLNPSYVILKHKK